MRLQSKIASLALLAAASTSAQPPQDREPFRIFFDWGKPELTRDARATLDEVAGEYRRLMPDAIQIVGHADRSGSDAVNLTASRRRAEAAKAYLAAQGVPAGAMAISGFGEGRPIVATEDGVREAQNRRVEITFR